MVEQNGGGFKGCTIKINGVEAEEEEVEEQAPIQMNSFTFTRIA